MWLLWTLKSTLTPGVPRADFLGKTASDMTNNVILPLLYCMIVYWTAGYRASAAAYAKFSLSMYLILSTAQSMGTFERDYALSDRCCLIVGNNSPNICLLFPCDAGLMMSVAIPSMALALVLAPPITLFFMIMGGFYIPLDDMHAGVEWLSWLSFARYGYSSLVVNEYADRMIACSDESASISIGFGEECPVPGENVLDSLGIRDISSDYWFNIGMIIALQLCFRVGAYALLRKS